MIKKKQKPRSTQTLLSEYRFPGNFQGRGRGRIGRAQSILCQKVAGASRMVGTHHRAEHQRKGNCRPHVDNVSIKINNDNDRLEPSEYNKNPAGRGGSHL